MTVSVRAIQQRTRCGTGVHWMPLLFALAIEPLSHMLKQTMSGIQYTTSVCINKQHVVLWQCVHTIQPSLVVDFVTLFIAEEWHCGHVHCIQQRTGHVH